MEGRLERFPRHVIGNQSCRVGCRDTRRSLIHRQQPSSYYGISKAVPRDTFCIFLYITSAVSVRLSSSHSASQRESPLYKYDWRLGAKKSWQGFDFCLGGGGGS